MINKDVARKIVILKKRYFSKQCGGTEGRKSLFLCVYPDSLFGKMLQYSCEAPEMF